MRKMQQSRRRQLLHGAEIEVVGIKEKSITLRLVAQSYGRYDEREKTLTS